MYDAKSKEFLQSQYTSLEIFLVTELGSGDSQEIVGSCKRGFEKIPRNFKQA